MAFPTLVMAIIQVVVLVIGLPIIYLLSKALKVQPKPIAIASSKKEVAHASLLILLAFLTVFVWRALTHAFQLDQRPPYYVDLINVLWMLVLDIPVLLTVAIVMKRTGQSLESIGISGKDKGRMLVLGFAVSAIFVTISGFLARSFGGGFAGFSSSVAYGLVLFAIVGFSEETIWRGYVQTRLTAYSGTLKGLVITSLLFAILWHFPAEYYAQSGAVVDALAGTLTRLAPSLLFGYIMLRSQNTIPSSVFHLFWNWNIYLWQLSF